MTEEDDIDGLAAEYVLGSLEPAERAQVEARRKADAPLAAAIEAWERRLGPLSAQVPGIEPPAASLRRHLARISASAGAVRCRAEVIPFRRGLGAGWTVRRRAGALAACLALPSWCGIRRRIPPGSGDHPRKLRQPLQGFLGELRSPEGCADSGGAARRGQPHGAARLRRVRSRRRAGRQGPVRAPEQDVVLRHRWVLQHPCRTWPAIARAQQPRAGIRSASQS